MVMASKGGPVAKNEIDEIGRDLLGKALCVLLITRSPGTSSKFENHRFSVSQTLSRTSGRTM